MLYTDITVSFVKETVLLFNVVYVNALHTQIHAMIDERNCGKRKNNGNNGIQAMLNVTLYQWATFTRKFMGFSHTTALIQYSFGTRN